MEANEIVYRRVRLGLLAFSLAFFLFAGIRTAKQVQEVSDKQAKEASANQTQEVSAKARKIPIYCVETEEKKVALSFDAAWGNDDTANILATLARLDVRVTFFMTGEWVSKYPDDVKAIAAAGHDLGNHSENHKYMSKLSCEDCCLELQKVHNRVKELTGVDMTLFRPPYGDYNNTLVEACDSLGYHCIQWDVDSLDWKNYGTDAVIRTVLNHKHLGNGSIILLHNGAKYTPKALEAIVTGLREQGYTLVPISELIYTGPCEMDYEGRQHPVDVAR